MTGPLPLGGRLPARLPPPPPQELLYNVAEHATAGVHPRHICLELDAESQVGASVALLGCGWLHLCVRRHVWLCGSQLQRGQITLACSLARVSLPLTLLVAHSVPPPTSGHPVCWHGPSGA